MLHTLRPWLKQVGQVGHSESIEVGIFAADNLLACVGGFSADAAFADNTVDSRFVPSRAGGV